MGFFSNTPADPIELLLASRVVASGCLLHRQALLLPSPAFPEAPPLPEEAVSVCSSSAALLGVAVLRFSHLPPAQRSLWKCL